MYPKFLASLLHALISSPGVEMPGAVEIFIEDYSRTEELDPDWLRLEDLFISTCQEHSSSMIYIILGSLENLERVPEDDRQALLRTIGRLWDNKRCKLLLSMHTEFFNKEFPVWIKKTLPEDGTDVFPLTPNERDVELFIRKRLAAGPFFMQTNDMHTRAVKKLREK